MKKCSVPEDLELPTGEMLERKAVMDGVKRSE